MITPLMLVGRVITKDGQNFTVTSVSTYYLVHVWDPVKRELLIFDSLEAFENWAYGKPILTVKKEKEAK